LLISNSTKTEAREKSSKQVWHDKGE